MVADSMSIQNLINAVNHYKTDFSQSSYDATMKFRGFKKPKLAMIKWTTKKNVRLLQQVIPAEDIDPPVEEQYGKQSSKNLHRPGFSLPLMTSNFRRFNAR